MKRFLPVLLRRLQGIFANPLVLVFVGAFLFSIAGVLIQPLKGELSILQIALLRSVLVVIVLRLHFFLTTKKNPIRNLPFTFSKWQLYGALCRALNTCLFIAALMLAGTGTGFLLCNSAPIYLAIHQIVVQRRIPNMVEFLTIVLNSLGLFMFLHNGLQATGVFGILFGVFGGLTFAGLIFSHGYVGKEGQTKNDEPFTVGTVLLGNLLAIPLILAVVFIPRLVLESGSQALDFWTSDAIWIWKWPSMASWGIILLLSIFQSAIPEILWAKSMREINPLLAAFPPTIVAVLAPTWTWIVLNEHFIDFESGLGIVLVHAAVIWIAVYQKFALLKK